MLEKIADTMAGQVRSGGFVRRELRGGLMMQLQLLRSGEWVLSLAREGVFPSDKEIEMCCAAFRVEYWVEFERVVYKSKFIVRVNL